MTVVNLIISFNLLFSIFLLFILMNRYSKRLISETTYHFKPATIFINNKQKQSKMTEVKDTQKDPIVIVWGVPVDAANMPAKVQDGKYALSSTDESIATVSQDADNPLKGIITFTGKQGDVAIKISADADLGPEVKTIEDFEQFSVISDVAVKFGPKQITGVN